MTINQLYSPGNQDMQLEIQIKLINIQENYITITLFTFFWENNQDNSIWTGDWTYEYNC